MRLSAWVAMLILCAVPVSAQDAGDCHAVSPSEEVVVTTIGGEGIRGLLLCLSEREILIAEDGRIKRWPLDGIRRIHTPADPVWDGAAKGAALPLIFWAVLCHQCEAGPMLRATLAYSLMGLTFDALQTHRRTVFTGGGRSAAFTWRLRF